MLEELWQRKMWYYDECPEVTSSGIGIYNTVEQLNMPFLVGRYKGIYKELVEGGGITPTKARIVAICKLISENNEHLTTALQNRPEPF